MGLHSDSLRSLKVVALQCGSRSAPGAIPTSGAEDGKTLEACCGETISLKGLKIPRAPRKTEKHGMFRAV